MTRSLQGPGTHNDPEPFSDLSSRLQQMQRQMGDLTSNVLRAAGIVVATALTTFDRVVKVVGGLIVEGPTDISGDLAVTGDASFSGTTTIGGNAAITGTLSLPAGIIDNEALTNPLRPMHDGGAAYGMAFALASEYVLALPAIPVPAGYDRAVVLLNGSGGVHTLVNNTFGVRCRLDVSDGTWWNGSRSDASVFAGGYQSSAAFTTWEGPVPPGGSITVSTRVVVGADIPADPYNSVDIGVTVIFTR